MFGVWKKAHDGIRRGWISRDDASSLWVIKKITTKRWFLTERAKDIRVFDTEEEAERIRVQVIKENPSWNGHVVVREVPKGARKETTC